MIAHLPPRARSIPRETEGAGRDLSASRASDVIDKECWYAEVRLWPVASFRGDAVTRPKSGVKQTCRHRSNPFETWLAARSRFALTCVLTIG